MLVDYLAVIGHDEPGEASLHRGQFHDVVITETAAYRFPRTESARAGLADSSAVLSTLADLDLGVALPRPLAPVDAAAPVGRCHLVTTRVPGGALDRADVDGDAQVAAAVSAELARLLSRLRHASADPELRRAIRETPPERWRDFAAAVRQTLYPLMSQDGRPRAEQELTAVCALPPVTGALVHGDLGGRNLLWRRDSGRPVLTGVVDWDDAAIGDQAADVAAIAVTYGWTVATDTLRLLSAKPEAVLARARAIAGTFALQQALPAAIDGDDADLREGLAGYRC